MGSRLVEILFSGALLLPHVASGQYTDDQVRVDKLRTHQDVVNEYCRIKDGKPNQFDDENCDTPSQLDKLDVVYAPQGFGDRVIQHLQNAFAKKYYQHVDMMDLFHGHFIAKGPQTDYASGAAWFNDVEMMLYHSFEHIEHVWKDLQPEEVYQEHAFERSFAGWAKGDVVDSQAAIDFILPTTVVKGYAGSGTIFAEELNDSLHISSHVLSGYDGNEPWLLTNSCTPGEANCKPCEVFNMMYLVADPKGRFTTPDGVRIEIFFHCIYKD